MKLLQNGKPIEVGARIESYNGTPYRFLRIAAYRVPGKAGKVDVESWENEGMTGTFYVTVFPSLEWSDDV